MHPQLPPSRHPPCTHNQSLPLQRTRTHACRSSSLASARSVYFDAVEGSFTDVPSRHPGSPYHPGDSEAPNPSPRGSLNSVSPRHSTELSTIPNHNKGEAGHGAAATHEFNLAALREEEQQERGGGACAGCCVIS